MFSFFKTDPAVQLRESSSVLLRHISKVWNYRQDVLDAAVAERLLAARENLQKLSAKDAGTENEVLSAAIEEAHAALCEAGGKVYPSRILSEWVELILVAAIIACSVRSFFLQPFKIPTNSMYPTYHGMTSEVFPLDEDGPSGLSKYLRKARLWTDRIEVTSPVSGEVLIPLRGDEIGHLSIPDLAKLADGRDDGIFGTGLLQGVTDTYYLCVNRVSKNPSNAAPALLKIPVPKDFTFRNVVIKTYFPEVAKLQIGENEKWRKIIDDARANNDLVPHAGQLYLRTRHSVPANGRVANFDVLTGDLVLVERISYNFVKPKAGSPFVFATKNIPRLAQDNYFIKRLVGTPGDTLVTRPPQLLRNGKPIEGKPAFDKNNNKRTDLEYYGYTTIGDDALNGGRPIPPKHYFAMGDNSGNSHDSRGWGLVPEKEVIGRAFFILYPFTNRWGLAE